MCSCDKCLKGFFICDFFLFGTFIQPCFSFFLQRCLSFPPITSTFLTSFPFQQEELFQCAAIRQKLRPTFSSFFCFDTFKLNISVWGVYGDKCHESFIQEYRSPTHQSKVIYKKEELKSSAVLHNELYPPGLKIMKPVPVARDSTRPHVHSPVPTNKNKKTNSFVSRSV